MINKKADITYEQVVTRLKEKYNSLHPLVFSRSMERAKGPGNAFDILESIPKNLPMVWSVDLGRWVETEDLTQSREFQTPELSE